MTWAEAVAAAERDHEDANLDRMLGDMFTPEERAALDASYEGSIPSCPCCGLAMDSAGGVVFEGRTGTVTLPAVWVCQACEVQIDR